ncbi:hypothetical protein H5410_036283 [Solanum commersonii]|uniref:Uncharacterized protein n=1 Tax=Solanum commersonii TaxID=4109 RepID=A0A9J5Y348_SOLCO|nr:hypothetical protein H5410_036283 [Solanum commersonii]
MTSKPNLKDKPLSTSIFVQTKDRYEMKPPETYLQAVAPSTPTKNKEKATYTPIMALDKEYECFGVPNLAETVLHQSQLCGNQYPLKA